MRRAIVNGLCEGAEAAGGNDTRGGGEGNERLSAEPSGTNLFTMFPLVEFAYIGLPKSVE